LALLLQKRTSGKHNPRGAQELFTFNYSGKKLYER
jgi:hypothetical protein